MSNLARKFEDIDFDQSQTTDSPPNESHGVHNEARVGELFREARHSLNLSIKNVADRIHVRSLYLEAIEMGHLDKLPSPLYAAGFIKLYARFLDLDGEELLRRINLKYEDDYLATKIVPLTTSIQPSRFSYYVSAALMAASLIIAGTVFLSKDTIVPVDVVSLPVPQPLSSQIESTSQTVTAPSTQATAADASGDPTGSAQTTANEKVEKVIDSSTASSAAVSEISRATPQSNDDAKNASIKSEDKVDGGGVIAVDDTVTFIAHQDCWMEIDKNGVIVFSRILRAGESYVITTPKAHRVSFGNAPGIEVQYHGKKMPPMAEGRVIKNLSLESSLRD